MQEVRDALAAGDDPNASPDGLPILHASILGGHTDIARMLIEHGADICAQDVLDVQRSPLWTCVTCERKQDSVLAVARMLLERGANPDGGCRDSPLAVARRRKWDRMTGLLEEFLTPEQATADSDPTFRAGDHVCIYGGLFHGRVGQVEQDADGDPTHPVKVRIELFGRFAVVEVPTQELGRLRDAGSPRTPESSPAGEPGTPSNTDRR